MRLLFFILLIVLVSGTSLVVSCQNDSGANAKSIEIDGSSTVAPIIRKSIMAYQKTGSETTINLHISGTGGGFKKFTAGETSISNASRAITATEIADLESNNVTWISIPIAMDGIAIVTGKENDWVESLSVEELRLIWSPASENQITTWDQVRSHWPAKALNPAGPGKESGTYDFFTEVVNGKSGDSRQDYLASEDDEDVASYIESNPSGIAYFGYSYYKEHSNRLRLIPIELERQIIIPTPDAILSGDYVPFSRTLYLYVNRQHVEKNRALFDYLVWLLENAPQLVTESDYIPLNSFEYEKAKIRLLSIRENI